MLLTIRNKIELSRGIRALLTIKSKIDFSKNIRVLLTIKSKMGLSKGVAWAVIEEVSITIFK